jgi:transcriptional regulator with PAS, ATPase and Fis domain
VAPLRERLEDIPMLMEFFLHKHATQNGKSVQAVDDDVVSLLQEYCWPGNVRELENTIERAVVLTTGSRVTREVITLPTRVDAGLQTAAAIPSLKLHENMMWMERETIRRALALSTAKSHAAKLMGISPRALSHYLTKYAFGDQPAFSGGSITSTSSASRCEALTACPAEAAHPGCINASPTITSFDPEAEGVLLR